MALCVINNAFADDSPLSVRLPCFVFLSVCLLHLHFPKIFLHTELVHSLNSCSHSRWTGCELREWTTSPWTAIPAQLLSRVARGQSSNPRHPHLSVE